MSILFVDIEGMHTEELCAIQMDIMSREILDIYLAYSKSRGIDEWARKHIHGLSETFLEYHGFENEDDLISDFKKWLRGRDILVMFANDPQKEEKALNLNIRDIGLPSWRERSVLISHQTAVSFKKKSVPILDKVCHAHSSFKRYPIVRQTVTELAKSAYGHYCALYDCYALYLHYILD